MLTIIIRTIVIYFFLVFIMKFGGKRQIGELQLSELVTALLLSEISSMPIGHDDIPIMYAIIPVTLLICLEIIFAFLETKIPFLKKIFAGKPSYLIKKGKLQISELESARISIDELIAEARIKGINDISTLEYAILEDNGNLSVFEKNKNPSLEKGISHALIIDGQISKNALKALNISENELLRRISIQGYNLKNIFLYTENDLGENYVVLRERKK